MKICNPEECTGCCACYNVCNHDAIKMMEDKKGAIIPIINENKCMSCGMCKIVCPILQNISKKKPLKCYAVYNKDQEDRKTSASGGAATVFARKIIKDKGVVYGTVFNYEKGVYLKRAKDEKDLELFKGSKYVYAYPDKIYQDVKESLKNNISLFVGTPCQVAGLKYYLKKEYDNLITIDIICHGTPPYKYLKEYISDLDLKGKISDVKFRGEKDYYFTVYSGEKIIYSENSNVNLYFRAFSEGVIHRENCYTCKFACEERVGDITIGDFWGLGTDALKEDKGKKSVVLINSEKGNIFFESVKPLIKFETRDIQEAINGNSQLRNPTPKSKDREEFMRIYVKQGFLKAVKETSMWERIKKQKVKNKLLGPIKIMRNFVEKK